MSSSQIFQVKAVVNVTAQQVSDQLTTAFEGGVGYWCCIHNYSMESDTEQECEKLGVDYGYAHSSLPLLSTGWLLLADAAEEKPEEYWLFGEIVYG